MRRKVTVVGAGNVGATCAQVLAQRDYADVSSQFRPDPSSTTGAGGGNDVLGLGHALARTASTSVSLTAPLSVSLLLFGFALALAGGLIAGGAGALRAARLRPADALRQME